MEMIILRLYFNMPGLTNQLDLYSACYCEFFKLDVSDSLSLFFSGVDSMGDGTIALAERLGTYLPNSMATSLCFTCGPTRGWCLPPSSNLHLDLAGQWNGGRVFLFASCCSTAGLGPVSSQDFLYFQNSFWSRKMSMLLVLCMQSKKVIITNYIFLSHENLIVYTTYYMRNYIVEMYKHRKFQCTFKTQ